MFASTFVSVAQADEMSDRLIAACVAQGDSVATCTCMASSMQATFTQAQFSQIVIALETYGSDGASEVMEAIFNTQPALVAAFTSAMASCG